jgi:hypothetical protein
VFLQNSRRFERNGRLARRKRRTSEKQKRSVPAPPSQLKHKTPRTVLLLPATNLLVDPFNSLLSATNQGLKFQANTRHLLEVFRNSKSTAATKFTTLAIQLHHMVLQTRCTVNVITPSCCDFLSALLTIIADNGATQQKYEH